MIRMLCWLFGKKRMPQRVHVRHVLRLVRVSEALIEYTETLQKDVQAAGLRRGQDTSIPSAARDVLRRIKEEAGV